MVWAWHGTARLDSIVKIVSQVKREWNVNVHTQIELVAMLPPMVTRLSAGILTRPAVAGMVDQLMGANAPANLCNGGPCLASRSSKTLTHCNIIGLAGSVAQISHKMLIGSPFQRFSKRLSTVAFLQQLCVCKEAISVPHTRPGCHPLSQNAGQGAEREGHPEQRVGRQLRQHIC